MAQFTVINTATTNATINTFDTWIEIKAAAGATTKIKRVRVGYGDGSQTVGVDNHYAVKLYRWDSGVGLVGSLAGSAIPRNANVVAGVSTIRGKNSGSNTGIGTTNATTIDVIPPNGRALYEWLSRDDDDMIVTKPGGFFGVVIGSAVASQLFSVTVDIVE